MVCELILASGTIADDTAHRWASEMSWQKERIDVGMLLYKTSSART
jgi:hypothetical protein